MARWVQLNFHLTVGLSIIIGIGIWAVTGTAWAEPLHAVFPLGQGRLMGAGMLSLLAVLQVFFWLVFYRQQAGHKAALVVGAMTLITAFGGVFNTTVNLAQPLTVLPYVLVYISVSHIAYAILDWQVWLGERL